MQKKVRRIPERPHIVCGFAGATADCFTLFERLEEKLDKHQGQLLQSVVGLAKDWRMDKYLRRLNALLIVADIDSMYTVTGLGDVIEPHDGIIGIGSGGTFALSAARALLHANPDMDAEELAKISMKVAADICVYTNHNWTIEVLEKKEGIATPTQSTPTTQTELLSQDPPKEQQTPAPPSVEQKDPEPKEPPKEPPKEEPTPTKKSWQQ